VFVSIRNILFPSNFSPVADAARDYAVALADQFRAKLHLIHVVPLSLISPRPATPWVTLENEMNMRVEVASQRLQHALDANWIESGRATHLTVVGFEVEEILNYARAHEIDLIVMGTHGRRGVSHFLLGSVAEKLVRMAECPVLTVHRQGREVLFDEGSVPYATS